ncbi:MAG: efflux RND transporter permease subunit, partial [Candidatus Latescibacteria bacterium]|nr:efflux RND transporter permease subunit [Candidatus Latescibacterota bacterium]
VSSGTWMNGKPSVRISVRKLPEEDLDAISGFVNDYVEEFNAAHDDVRLDISFDFLEILKSRLHLLYSNGGLGLALVVLTLGIFLSTRLALWVAWGIPASFLAMFIAAVLQGVTINMVSLFGMILVIGILVDDGIVIAENIFTHFENGKSPKRAAVDGTMEVLPAVITSVTTTIVAFTPLMLVTGSMEFMYEMAFVVIVSLSFSLMEAFLVLPAHIGTPHILRKRKESFLGNIRKVLDRIIGFFRYKVYGGLLKIIIRWKWAVLATPVSIIMISIGLFQGRIIKTTFFPSIPFDSFSINIAFTPGSGEKRTMDYIRRFDDIVWEVNDELVEEYNQTEPFIRFTFMTLGSALSGKERGSHAGNVSVMLRDMEGSPISSFEIANRVRRKIGKVPDAERFTVGANNRWGSPVSISLLDRNLDELDEAKNYLMEQLREIPAITNITDTNAIGKREVRLKLTPKAYFLGLNLAGISSQVRQGFFGGQSQRLQQGKDEIRVWVRYPKQGRVNLGQVESMKIKTPSGNYPLTELASYHIERGPVNIHRFNGSREARIEADMLDPYAPVPPVLEQIRKTIITSLQAQYPGVRVVYQGQQRRSEEATGQIIKLFGAAFAIIVLILMIHFKSFSQPLIVICMIPLAVLGAAWGHGIEGIPVSIMSMWGMVALSGTVINDAVVFLSKYNSNLVDGMTVEEAVYDAGVARFRAILLTTVTTIAGLYPIVLEKSFQAQFLKPMAISLAYGVMVGTTFILLFFPVYILVLNDVKVFIRYLLTKQRPSRESVEPAVINANVTLD